MDPSRVLCNAGFLILGLVFSSVIIQNYWIRNDWNKNIYGLGSDKILMNLHFVGGILAMILYPIQRMIVSLKIIHILIGVILYLCGIMSSIGGITFIVTHHTIGGQFMDISFAIYGALMFFISLYGFIVSIWLCTTYDDIKYIHYNINNIYGALIYSSLFYRVLYTYAKIFNYPIPTNSTPNYYKRPLDQTFQVLFYTIPLFMILIYNYVVYKRLDGLRTSLKCLMTLAMAITILLILV